MLATSPALGDLSSDGPIPYAMRQKLTGWVTLPATLDLKSKTVLVTGATSGIGYETARELLRVGANLILGARDVMKAQRCVEELKKEKAGATITVLWLDLEVLDSVKKFGRALEEQGIKLHMAILNAGAYFRDSRVTVDGFDAIFQVNFLATAYLARQILPRLAGEDDGPARLVLVTSEAHAWARFDTQKFSEAALPSSAFARCSTASEAAETYSTAKLLLALFARELAGRVDEREVCVVSTTPGFCASNFFPDDGWLTRIIMLTSARSTQAGARLHVHAAVAPAEEVHGRYMRDGAVCRLSHLAEGGEGHRLQGVCWRDVEALA